MKDYILGTPQMTEQEALYLKMYHTSYWIKLVLAASGQPVKSEEN